MLPPIFTGAELSSRPTSHDRLPAASTFQRPPRRLMQGQTVQEPSSKRLRLSDDSIFPPHPSCGRSPLPRTPPKLPALSQDPRASQYWPPRQFPSRESLYTTGGGCHACTDAKALAEEVLSGLEQLETELKHALASAPMSRNVNEQRGNLTGGPNVEAVGLRDSLIWVSGSITSSTRLVRELATAQRALLRMSEGNLGAPPAHEKPGAMPTAPPDFSRGSRDNLDRDRLKEGHQRCLPDTTQLPQPSHPSASPACIYGSNQSPMGIGGSNFMLPSPSSLHTPSTVPSAPGGYSPNPNQPAHTSSLRDLQCQISTKSPALTNLQREHDHLRSVHHRLQIRCQTLDKKSQISDLEIDTLTEEKLRFQTQVEDLEIQVDDLMTARDEAQKQMTASGAQFTRIVNMSSKLQAQGAEEAKKYKQDSESWERHRQDLHRQIQELQTAQTKSPGWDRDGSQVVQAPTVLAKDHALASATLDELRTEVVRLRDSLLSMERMFANVRQGTEKVGHVIDECSAGRQDRLSTTTKPTVINSDDDHSDDRDDDITSTNQTISPQLGPKKSQTSTSNLNNSE